jgi:hypothetical protein
MDRGVGKEDEQRRELQELLGKWQFRNFGRVRLPAFVGVAAMMNIIRKEGMPRRLSQGPGNMEYSSTWCLFSPTKDIPPCLATNELV